MLNPLFENQGIRFQSEVLMSKLSVLIQYHTHPFHLFENTTLFRDSSEILIQCHTHHFISLQTPTPCSDSSEILIQCHTHHFISLQTPTPFSETVQKFWFSVTLLTQWLIHLISLKTPTACSETVQKLWVSVTLIHFFENTTGLFRESSEIVQLYISSPPSCISLFRQKGSDASWQDNNEPPSGVSAAL